MTYDVIDSGGGIVLGMEDSFEATPVPRRKLLTPNKVLLGQCVRTQQSFPSQTSTEITFEILNADHAVFAKLTYEPRQGRDDKVFIETISQKFLFFGSIQHQTLNLTDFVANYLLQRSRSHSRARVVNHLEAYCVSGLHLWLMLD